MFDNFDDMTEEELVQNEYVKDLFRRAGIHSLPISREDIEARNISTAKDFMKKLRKQGKVTRSKATITFSGYSHSTDEIFEISEIRQWVTKFIEEYPYWFYHTDVRMNNDLDFMSCLFDIEVVSHGPKITANQLFKELMHNERDSIPLMPTRITIPADKWKRILDSIVTYSKSLGDLEGGRQVVRYLREKYTNIV